MFRGETDRYGGGNEPPEHLILSGSQPAEAMTKPKPPELHKKSGPKPRARKVLNMKPPSAITERFEALKTGLNLTAPKLLEKLLNRYEGKDEQP